MDHSLQRKESPTIAGADVPVDATVEELVKLLARERAGRLRGWCRRPVTSTSLNVLLAVEAEEPLAMSRLAELLELSLPNVTGIVGRMAEHGLVARRSDPSDRRLVLVVLTDHGREIIEEHGFMRRADIEQVLAAMPAAHRRALVRSFRTFLDTAERLRACGALLSDDTVASHRPTPTQTRQGVPLR